MKEGNGFLESLISSNSRPLLTTTNQTDTTTSANSVTILSSGTTTTIVLDFVVGTDDGIDKGESENELGVEKKRAARIPSAHAIMSPNQEGKFISRNKSNEVEALQQHHNAHKFRFHSGLFQGERHSRVGFNQQPVHPLQSKPANSAEDLASPKAYQSRHEKFYGLCIFLIIKENNSLILNFKAVIITCKIFRLLLNRIVFRHKKNRGKPHIFS